MLAVHVPNLVIPKKMSRPGFFPPGFRPLAYGAPGHAVKGAFRADGREDKRMSPAAT